MKRDLAIVAALVISALAVYAQTLGFEFVDHDDQQFATENAAAALADSIQAPLAEVERAQAPPR